MYAELRYLAVLYVYWVTVPQLHHLFFNWYSLRCDQAWWIRAFGEQEAIFCRKRLTCFCCATRRCSERTCGAGPLIR